MRLDVALLIYFECSRHCRCCTKTVSSCDLHMETCDHLILMMILWTMHKHPLWIPGGQKTHNYRSLMLSFYCPGVKPSSTNFLRLGFATYYNFKPPSVSFQKYLDITEHQHIVFSVARSHSGFGYNLFFRRRPPHMAFSGYCCRLCVCLLTLSTFTSRITTQTSGSLVYSTV